MHPLLASFLSVAVVFLPVLHLTYHSPLIWPGIAVVYFLPTVVGLLLHRNYATIIFLINFAIGWTIVGWLLALFVALVARDAVSDQDDFLKRQYRATAGLSHRSGLRELTGRLKLGPGFLKPVAFPRGVAPLLHFTPLPRVDSFTAAQIEPIQIEPIPGEPQIIPEPHLSAEPHITAESHITWIDRLRPARKIRLEYADSPRHFTTHNLFLTCLGADPDGHEYLGGVVGKHFRAFRTDHILRIRAA